MTTDPNFWKNKYNQTWSQSSEREKMIAQKILEETGKNTEFIGLGSGTNTYLEGTAKSRGYDKGQADLHILETNIYLEVTGPLITSVKDDAPLWVRPDKIKSASDNVSKYETWIIHHLPFNNLIRVIKLDEVFFKRNKNNDFPTVHPRIRGQEETYIEISAKDECVLPWNVLIDRINNL